MAGGLGDHRPQPRGARHHHLTGSKRPQQEPGMPATTRRPPDRPWFSAAQGSRHAAELCVSGRTSRIRAWESWPNVQHSTADSGMRL